ncbi:MAG: ATP-binding protein [Candidatus Thermoplasmatota archaeon]
MRTLVDHIFELVQNSINAKAQKIRVVVEEDARNNSFKIVIEDDGQGIKPEHLSRIKNAFFTTQPHNKRRVGLGLSLMDAACQQSGGTLTIESEYRHGTVVTAAMEHDHVDRPPLGDLPDLFASLILSTQDNKVLWTLEHVVNGRGYCLRNRATADELNILSYTEPGAREKLYHLIVKKERELHH